MVPSMLFFIGLIVAQATPAPPPGTESIREAPAEYAYGHEQDETAEAKPPDGPKPLEPTADEAAVLAVLGELASAEPETVSAGIAAARKSGSVLFAAPLRALLRS
ncbi:MAG: hypothetical protein V3T05_03205, partial [Myxococcota bacterium]